MAKILILNKSERWISYGLLILWGLLFLPNLRTNPNWYGDEGIVMEEAWTLANGSPRYGAMREDFLTPNPHPPFYLLLLGGTLRVFGNDVVVGRALQALTALATALVAFWVGCLLRSKKFGFLCAAAFLCYPEVVIHYRWVRGHPMMGMWALACIGFLIRYVQGKQWQDVLWAGICCSLAMATHYFAFSLAGAVIATALFVNRRHIPVAFVSASAFAILFLAWFAFFQPGGVENLMHRLAGASQQGFKSVQPSLLEEFFRLYRLVAEFIFLTPTAYSGGVIGVDFWILAACLGLVFFPVTRYRKWLILWLASLMFGAFASRDTVGLFLYQAFSFIPLLAIGFAGLLVSISDSAVRRWPQFATPFRTLPALLALAPLGIFSIVGSFGHLQTKVDHWTVRSWQDAERVMQFVNEHTGPDDFVVMPDQLYWLYDHPRKAQLIHCSHYEYGLDENFSKGVALDQYWFDPSLANAKFLVLAIGTAPDGEIIGIDALFWSSYEGPRKLIERVQEEKWPVVFQQGEYMVLANPAFLRSRESP